MKSAVNGTGKSSEIRALEREKRGLLPDAADFRATDAHLRRGDADFGGGDGDVGARDAGLAGGDSDLSDADADLGADGCRFLCGGRALD